MTHDLRTPYTSVFIQSEAIYEFHNYLYNFQFLTSLKICQLLFIRIKTQKCFFIFSETFQESLSFNPNDRRSLAAVFSALFAATQWQCVTLLKPETERNWLRGCGF